MQQRLLNIYNRAKERWGAFDRNQKLKILITAAAVVISLVTLILLLSRPNMVTIYQNLDYASAGEITNALSDAGISSRTIRNSTAIQVNEKDADKAMQYLAERDIPRGGKFDFASAFTFMGMGTTETVKKKVMSLYDEKDLAEKLKKMDGITDATVTLVLAADDRYFLKESQRATASVQLFSDRDLSKQEATSIARYISKCVKNLDMEDITIINGKFETLYSATGQGIDGNVGTQEEARQLRQFEIENKIRAMLLPMYDDVRLMANIHLNWDKQFDSSTTYGVPLPDSETGIPIRESTSQSSVTGTAPADAPGTDSNSNATPSYQTGDEGAYSGSTRDRDTDYAIDVFESQREYALGTVDYDNSSLIVMLYKYKTYNEREMTDAVLGGLSWADFKAANNGVRVMPVGPELDETIRIIGIKNTSIISYELPVFVDSEPAEPAEFGTIILYAIMVLLILLLGFGAIRKMQPDEVTEIEPELSVEELLVSTQMEDEKIAEVEKLQEIAFNQESEAKRQIEKFVQEKPEAVAQLLRNWLNDEWGD